MRANARAWGVAKIPWGNKSRELQGGKLWEKISLSWVRAQSYLGETSLANYRGTSCGER